MNWTDLKVCPYRLLINDRDIDYCQQISYTEDVTYYSSEFNACEINSAFCAMPKSSTIEVTARKTRQDGNTVRQLPMMLN